MEGQRGTNRSQRGLFFKFMFISVLKRVESLFKNSSAAPIHDKKDRSRHGAAVCGAGSGPGALLPGGTGTAGGAAAARDGGERLGNRLGRREGLCPGHAAAGHRAGLHLRNRQCHPQPHRRGSLVPSVLWPQPPCSPLY